MQKKLIPMKQIEAAPVQQAKSLLKLSYKGLDESQLESAYTTCAQKARPYAQQMAQVLPLEGLHQILLSGELYLCTEGDSLHGIIYVAYSGDSALFEVHETSDLDLSEFINPLLNALLPELNKVGSQALEPKQNKLSRSLQRAGFEPVGRHKREALIDGVVQDRVVFEVLNPQFRFEVPQEVAPEPVAVPQEVPMQPTDITVQQEDELYANIDKMPMVDEPKQEGAVQTAQNMVRPPVWNPKTPPAINGVSEVIEFKRGV